MGRRQADGHRRAATPSRRVGGAQHLGTAYGLERRARTTSSRLFDGFHRGFRVGRVDDHGCTQFARQVALGGDRIDRDDGMGAGGDRAEKRREPDAAQSEDRDALAGRDPRGVDHCPDSGENRAAEQRRDLGFERRIHAHGGPRRDDRLLGESGHSEMVVDRRAGGVTQPAGAREQAAGDVRDRAWLAERRAAVPARSAVTAGGHEREHHPVTDRELANSLAEFGHLAARFVAEDHRQDSRT